MCVIGDEMVHFLCYLGESEMLASDEVCRKECRESPEPRLEEVCKIDFFPQRQVVSSNAKASLYLLKMVRPYTCFD